MKPFSADYFDGLSARAHAVTVSLAGERIRVRGDAVDFFVALDTLSVAPPVGNAVGVVQWGDSATGSSAELHTRDAATLAELVAKIHPYQPERLAARLESRLIYAVLALVVAAGIVFAGLRWGVPLAADRLVARLPASIEARLGEQSLAAMDATMLGASRLAPARQRALKTALAKHCQTLACPAYTLHFRDGKHVGPNAFALPGGALIMTDQLVKLARHDDELLGVLAHELGHVERRHGVRLAIQSLGAGVVLIAITGDVGSLSDAAAGLPALLLRAGYSRDMEREADAYALDWMQRACITPARYVDLLDRLNTRHSRNKQTSATGLLDSHPGTAQRLAAFKHARVAATCR